MAETACLRRSLSQPIHSSREADEGDVARALTESISFGRFMSESLAWEKWSTFSHNRYLEEVEKFSKPGSVAQMKAYFEAHFKKRAATRAAEKANVVANDFPKTESSNKIQKDASFDAEAPKASTNMIINEYEKRENPCAEVDCSSNISSCDAATSEANSMTMVKGDQIEEEKHNNIENISLVANLKKLENTENNEKLMTSARKIANKEDLTSSKKVEQANTSSRAADLSKGPRLSWSRGARTNAMQVKIETSASSCKKQSPIELKDKKRLTLKSIFTLTDLTANSDKATKLQLRKSKDNSTALRIVSKFTKNKIHDAAPTTKKPSGESSVRQRLIRSSLHTSISFASSLAGSENPAEHIGEAPPGNPISKKRSVLSSLNRSNNFASHIGGGGTKSIRMPRNESSLAVCSNQASVSCILEHPSKTRLGNKRDSNFVGRSISGGMSNNGKWQSLIDRGKQSNPNESKAQTSTRFSPFSFKSEERAVKRKEFFKKLEEKNNTKESKNKK